MAAPAAFLAALRMRALAYRYDYDSAVHARIIADVHATMGPLLDDPNDHRRRTARASAHYRAQLALRSRASIWGFEFAAAAGLVFFLLWGWLKNLVPARKSEPCDGVRLVFAGRYKINPEIFLMPGDLGGEIVTRPLVDARLWAKDVAYILTFLVRLIGLRTPFPFQLALKCAVDLAAVRACLAGLSPRWVIVYWEFNCAVTTVADVLSRDGIATYNVMHGDKNLFAKNAFFEVDRCYCWNTFYVELFREEHVRADFRLFENPSFRLSPEENAWIAQHPPEGIGIVVPTLPTLAEDRGAAENAAYALAAACNRLAERHRVTVRPHPFYPDDFVAMQTRLSSRVVTATAREETPRAFILRHAILVGTLSTVLLEAAQIGRRVILLRTPPMADMERYHYLYGLPNVSACAIDVLEQTIEDALRAISASSKT